MSARAVAVAILLGACGADLPDLALDIRESSDRRAFASVELLHLRAERDGRTLAERTFPPSATEVSIDGLDYGARTVVALEGTSAAGDVVARGRTCPIDFAAPGPGGRSRAPLYFAPTNSFAPTSSPPLAARLAPVVFTLPDGDALLAGGAVGDRPVASVERFAIATGTFTAFDSVLSSPRLGAETIDVPGFGALVSGGIDETGAAVAGAELYRDATATFSRLDSAVLGARVGHRAVRLLTETLLVTGGAARTGDVPLDSSALVRVQPEGGATVSAGPPLVRARTQHAAIVASGTPVLIGGYGVDGRPLASLEALVPTDAAGHTAFVEVAALRTARAEATASVLGDGTILVVGGAGDALGTPLLDAEVYNPITELTVVYPLALARRGHTASNLPDGRVLVIGGVGADGAPLASVELFVPGVGFVSERPLTVPRAGHRAIPLCDGTVLVVGGGEGAELYTPPP